MSRQFHVSGTHGEMFIVQDNGYSTNQLETIAQNPTSYLSNLYFHTGFDYMNLSNTFTLSSVTATSQSVGNLDVEHVFQNINMGSHSTQPRAMILEINGTNHGQRYTESSTNYFRFMMPAWDGSSVRLILQSSGWTGTIPATTYSNIKVYVDG